MKLCHCCGRIHSDSDWLMLPYVGLWVADDESMILELRNCDGIRENGKPCNSTISIDVTEEMTGQTSFSDN